jgi:hypothetical protein
LVSGILEVMDLEAALADAEEALDQLSDERQAIDAAMEQRRAEIVGLRLAIERHGRRTVPSPKVLDLVAALETSLDQATVRTGVTWRSYSRVDAVEKVLQEVEQPMSPGDITAALSKRGRDDSANDVSASLAYLKRLGRAVNVGRAQWTTPKRQLREVAT